MWTKQVTDMIIAGVGETLYMTLFSTFFGYVFGMPLGILLKVSDKEGLRPNAVLYKILDVIANIFRSIPFLILLILLIPQIKKKKKLWNHSHHRTPYHCGNPFYRTNGRVFLK